MDSLDRLAQLIVAMHKENRNPVSTAPRVGKVISASPLRIQYGESIILEQRHLIISESLMAGYCRKVELTDLKLSGNNPEYPARITFYNPGGNVTERIIGIDVPPTVPESHENKLNATITFVDGLKEGDEVIIQPDESLQLWFVMDKVWKEAVT
ncbi:DUF2577 domain-containing protein [Brevibacillus agri]|uniref:DUF2577 domain-containing protein n=1 Tax=Brevibacillus TaxID=55080 RepID=UPI002E1D3D5D|nr:DUF2577 domain-containing protein [Brevibacillus agri]MED1654418.1 DUF2577 domain-containing protein [Brevibacillus agri]MED1688101.1 DUF2577 domain-containing protein [Brevibacillus agri]MED1691169.1 DUF2577 domain-containing protein [Brevibacillus agri]MED1699405.1 DUF2577 domain-containing protein [Brevibacillus agri]